jgi:uncharacterized protein YprB with RNaseH-like and TPR domain
MDDLKRRLARLGLTTGRNYTPKPRVPKADIEELVEGQVIETGAGPCFVIERRCPVDTRHGAHTLGEWLSLGASTLARLGDSRKPGGVQPDQYLFLDTETTGLGGGAFAFQVGIGFFSGQEMLIRQYFLRDPAEEPAMLSLLHELLQSKEALVTFNGRTFDVPLLAGRFLLSRQKSNISTLPNLDLLGPSRRLWRRRLESCSLGSLETGVLSVHRTQSDVPGSLIPYLYRQYLETHDARDMVRVLYHNEIDLLSMVTLGVKLAQTFDRPENTPLPVDDRLSLARWYQGQGMHDEAESAYRIAAGEAPDADRRYDALTGLAYLLKRSGRREEALTCWIDIADLRFDTLGHVELAKHYEWHQVDLEHALVWTETAITLAYSWRPGYRRTQALEELNHRQKRLIRKLSGASGDDSSPPED